MSGRLSIAELSDVFADLTAIDVGDDGVAAIDYSADFRRAFGYFRAVLPTDERSERTLRLTATCLYMNPANYTVWHFRRLCLEAVYEDAESADNSYVPGDLELAAVLGGDNPKNYQIWYHRRALLERLADPTPYIDAELEYISNVLSNDAKNYHAWSHRQWVTSIADQDSIYAQELEFVEDMITRDVRNNSAWNHRWFISHGGRPHGSFSSAETATVELGYALEKARLDPYNESPWRYYIAVLKQHILSMQDAQQVTSLLSECNDHVLAIGQGLGENTPLPHSSNLTSALIDILEFKGDQESLAEAARLAETLANKHDTIRRKYWSYRAGDLQRMMGAT